MSNLEEKSKYNLINFWRFVCSLLVVAIHTVTIEQYLGYFIVVSSRIAVPFFFICSGYFLCNKLYENDKDIRKKHIYRYGKNIFNMYLLWSLIYLVVEYKSYFGHGNIIKSILLIIRNFLFTGIAAHLWYLGALCFSVILLYVLVNKLEFKQIYVLAILLYIFSLSADTYYGLFSNTIVGNFINIYIKLFGEVWNSFAQGLIFIVMGIAIKKYEIAKRMKKSMKVVIIFYLLFIIEHFIMKYFHIARDNNTSIFLLILAPYIFITLLNLESKYSTSRIQKYSNILKNTSLTIYLIHPLVIKIVLKLFSISNFNQHIYQSYINFIVVSVISIIIALVIEKYKVSKEIKKLNYIKIYD